MSRQNSGLDVRNHYQANFRSLYLSLLPRLIKARLSSESFSGMGKRPMSAHRDARHQKGAMGIKIMRIIINYLIAIFLPLSDVSVLARVSI